MSVKLWFTWKVAKEERSIRVALCESCFLTYHIRSENFYELFGLLQNNFVFTVLRFLHFLKKKNGKCKKRNKVKSVSFSNHIVWHQICWTESTFHFWPRDPWLLNLVTIKCIHAKTVSKHVCEIPCLYTTRSLWASHVQQLKVFPFNVFSNKKNTIEKAFNII